MSDARATTGYASRVDRDEVMRVLRAFETAGLEYVLIGAAAMGFHGLGGALSNEEGNRSF